MLWTASRRLTVLAATVAGALALSAQASAIDVNRDGYHDALLREDPYLPYPNVGGACTYGMFYGQMWVEIAVRPPRVWGLYPFQHLVAWRARFINTATNRYTASDWSFQPLSGGQYTDFGGGRNAPNIAITSSEYWQNSKVSGRLPHTTGIVPLVDVAWLNPYTNQWVSTELKVQWIYKRGPSGEFVQPSSMFNGC